MLCTGKSKEYRALICTNPRKSAAKFGHGYTRASHTDKKISMSANQGAFQGPL